MNIITLERISKVFTERKVFEDTDFYLQEGEKVGVVGINGTGKTTLLRIIGGLEEPDDGKVIRANHLVIRYLPQHPEYQPEDDMLECITKGLTGEEKVNTQTRAKTMLTGLGINDFTQKAGTLSGGQQKRLALVEILLSDADVLLLDEPTNGVDPISRREFWNLLHASLAQGILVIMTTAYMDEAERCSQVILMESGRVLGVGEPKTLLAQNKCANFDEFFLKRGGVK